MTDHKRTDPINEILNRTASGHSDEVAGTRAVIAALRLTVPTRPLQEADPDLVSRVVDGRDHESAATLDPTSRRAVADVARLTDRLAPSRARRFSVWLATAAAAAATLFIIGGSGSDPDGHRSSTLPASVVPEGLAATEHPAGLTLAWRPVPEADRYEVTLFDSTGTLLHLIPTKDTSVVLPTDGMFGNSDGSPETLFWRVRAHLDIQRWSESVLAEVAVSPQVRP